MEISERLTCLFSAAVEDHEHGHVIEIPKDEVEIGSVDPTDGYQLAVFELPTDETPPTSTSSEPEDRETKPHPDRPPVTEGETRIVEIEEIGDQGDGLARVDRGYVVIVPGADKGERVEIELESVQENVGFARVVDRIDYYQ